MTTRIDHRFAKHSAHLSPTGRGRFRRSRNRVRGYQSRGRSVRSIISRTPSRFLKTSMLVTRTTRKPQDSSICVRSASRAISSGMPCVAPSTSITSLPSMVTKSTTYRSMGCWRRNFHRSRRRLRGACHSRTSALVCDVRSLRALFLNRSIPLTRPLRGRPLPIGERCNTRRILI